MPELRIPSDEQAGLAKLQSISDDVASRLLAAIQSAASRAETDGLTIANLAEVSDLSKADQESILDTLLSLYRVRAFSEVSLDEFIADVCDAMISAERPDFSPTDEAVRRLKDRLGRFLGIEDLDRAAKATVLRYEHERTVHGLRILTDARPVFGGDVSKAPEAVVINHTLKLSYHYSGRIKEAFFAFDEKDLQELKRAVERAQSKAASLCTMLAKAEVKVFKLS